MTQTNALNYQKRTPEDNLSDFIKCFWSLENESDAQIPVTILPDGYFDILFVSVEGKPFVASLIGLATIPATFTVLPNSRTFAISFKLPASEYILKTKIGSLLDKRQGLAQADWSLTSDNFLDFDTFVASVTAIMIDSLSSKTDKRKLGLFTKIYETDGSVMVEELAELVVWKSRQINRYFQNNFGLSLKKYCNILRFRASFDQLHNGDLNSVQGYFDQSHFIRDVHKFSGTSPKHLANDKNDCFIQLSTLSDQ